MTKAHIPPVSSAMSISAIKRYEQRVFNHLRFRLASCSSCEFDALVNHLSPSQYAQAYKLRASLQSRRYSS